MAERSGRLSFDAAADDDASHGGNREQPLLASPVKTRARRNSQQVGVLAQNESSVERQSGPLKKRMKKGYKPPSPNCKDEPAILSTLSGKHSPTTESKDSTHLSLSARKNDDSEDDSSDDDRFATEKGETLNRFASISQDKRSGREKKSVTAATEDKRVARKQNDEGRKRFATDDRRVERKQHDEKVKRAAASEDERVGRKQHDETVKRAASKDERIGRNERGETVDVTVSSKDSSVDKQNDKTLLPPPLPVKNAKEGIGMSPAKAANKVNSSVRNDATQQMKAQTEAMVGSPEQVSTGSNLEEPQQRTRGGVGKPHGKKDDARTSFPPGSKVQDVEEMPLQRAKGSSRAPSRVVANGSDAVVPSAYPSVVIPEASKFADEENADVLSGPMAVAGDVSYMNQNVINRPFQPVEQEELQPLPFTSQGPERGDVTTSGSTLQQQTQEFDTEKDVPPSAKGRSHASEATVPVRAQVPTVYEEETAFLHFNPPFPVEGKRIPEAVPTEKLGNLPIPDDPDESKFPNTGKCKWSFDKATRVLLADFRQENEKVELLEEDERFLYEMMERDDITCISDGLANNIDPNAYNPNTLFNAAGNEFFHKNRRFDKMNQQEAEALSETHVTCKYKEKDFSLAMQVKDFSRYVGMHEAALKAEAQGKADEVETKFEFTDQSGKLHTIEDVRNTVLYMIDFDVIKLLPKLYEAIQNDFLLPGILPGGIHCMMNAINVNGRPFMGPNAYLTPPGSFTQVHQDGHGTVDSGHLCLTGYNEVVMLRRLPERHKMHALSLLRGEGGGEEYDGLYGLPHDEGGPEKPDWPTTKAIDECKKKGYCPSVFILGPGQLVHINKGRIHAFRKLWPEYLFEIDCHYFLRRGLLDELKARGIDRTTPGEFLCFSIAWDWMYRGVTVDGISRETTAILECSILNRLHNRQSLAIPELAILRMASSLSPLESYQPIEVSRLFERETGSNAYPPTKCILRGILPSLRYVVQQQVATLEKAKDANHQEGAFLSIEEIPNSWQNPQEFPLDPYGNSDFFCKLCSKELSNVYMHCDGCEKLLQKDFNICVDCHREERHKTFVKMHPRSDKRRSLLNHTGDMKFDRAGRCPCKNGPKCDYCEYCVGCSCKCHERFTVMTRFYGPEDMKSLERRVENVAYEANDDEKEASDGLSRDKTVASRLAAAMKPLREVPTSNAVVSLVGAKGSSAIASTKQQSKRTSKNSTSGKQVPVPAANQRKAGAASIWGKESCKLMLQNVLENFDPSNSPTNIRPSICRPTIPTSREDLSDSALASTEPKGSFPALDRGGTINFFKQGGPNSLVEFMDKARELDPRTPTGMVEILSASNSAECSISENDVRHLFRNFADTEVIDGVYSPNGLPARIDFSLREIEIMLYCLLNDYTLVKCRELMPYRKSDTLNNMWATLKKNIFKKCAVYKRHLDQTVGMLFELESEATLVHGRASSKEARKIRAAKRTRESSDPEGIASSRADRRAKRVKSTGMAASLDVAEGTSAVQVLPPKKRRKQHGRPGSVWNDTNCAATIRSVLEGFNVAERPDNMRSTTCQPSRPSSRYDLSDSTIAFTEPKGHFPTLDRGTSITCFSRGGHDSLREFMEKARELNPRTPTAMLEMLSASNLAECSTTEDDVRHMFRNFADTEVIEGVYNPSGDPSRIHFSLREIEIVIYCLLRGDTRGRCRELMPYRGGGLISNIWGTLRACLDYIRNCEAYKTHLEQTVGLLFSLEHGEGHKQIPTSGLSLRQAPTIQPLVQNTSSRKTVAPGSGSRKCASIQKNAPDMYSPIANTGKNTEAAASLGSKRPAKRARSMGTTASLGAADESEGHVVVQVRARKKEHRHHRPTGAYNDKNCTATIRSVLQGFNGADRPENVLPSTCQPSRPTSRDDLSDSALAFTEPRGSFPAVDRGMSITCFVRGGHNALIEFMDKARELSERTPAAMVEILTASNSAECAITEDDVRHMFRNFSDTEVITGSAHASGGPSVYFSSREVAIMLYCVLIDPSGNITNLAKKCSVLMPYRRASNLTKFVRALKRSVEGICEAYEYKAHLEQTVGLLFRLERGEATEAATGGPTSTEARDIRTATPGPPARLKVTPKGPVRTPSVQTGHAGLKEATESQSQELSSAPVEATLPENQDASLGASKMRAAAEYQSGKHDDSDAQDVPGSSLATGGSVEP